MTNLWKYDHYDAKCEYIFGRKITEYDISKANIAILNHMGFLSEEEYKDLASKDRMQRQYIIGCMQRDNPKVKEALFTGLTEARRNLCENLKLEDHNILHINRDAIFIVDPLFAYHPDSYWLYDHVEFTNRGSYLSYYRLDSYRKTHFYVGKSRDIDGNEKVFSKVRGMSAAALELHDGAFRQILERAAEIEIDYGCLEAYKYSQEKFNFLLNTDDIRYLRRFDSTSRFDIKNEVSRFASYQADYLRDVDVEMIDRSYNLYIIAKMGNMYMSELMAHK